MSQDSTTGESLIGGVSVRSWLAAAIIVPGMLTLCYDAITTSDVQWILVPMSTALGFLFGKSSGVQSERARTLSQ